MKYPVVTMNRLQMEIRHLHNIMLIVNAVYCVKGTIAYMLVDLHQVIISKEKMLCVYVSICHDVS